MGFLKPSAGEIKSSEPKVEIGVIRLEFASSDQEWECPAVASLIVVNAGEPGYGMRVRGIETEHVEIFNLGLGQLMGVVELVGASQVPGLFGAGRAPRREHRQGCERAKENDEFAHI